MPDNDSTHRVYIFEDKLQNSKSQKTAEKLHKVVVFRERKTTRDMSILEYVDLQSNMSN
jgi:hypothetical protein